MQKLYYGGDIITMVQEQDRPEAVLVEDAQIRYVGSLKEAKALCGAETEYLDLRGKTLMPSFIDGHSHISMYSQFAAFPDVSGCTSFAELQDFLGDYLRTHKLTGADVLLAVGYDHNFLKEEAHPTREILDAVSDEVPIYLYHSSGHMGVANTPLLRITGLGDDTKDPEGGRYGRYEDGRLNGYAEEPAAFVPILMTALSRISLDPVEQMRRVQDIYLKYGITTVQDGGTSREVFAGFSDMAGQGIFRVDVVSYLVYNEEPGRFIAEHPEMSGRYWNHLKIGGAKIFLDGSPQGRSAWLTKPYEGEERYRGYPTQTDEAVEEACRLAIEHGYQLLAHANGDAASDQYIRCYKKAMERAGKSGLDLRPVMIHCQTVRDDQLEEMAEIGMVPSIFVAHTYYWGDVHLKNLGAVRGAHISPAKAAKDCGLRYNFHQDCPVLPPDMMRTVWCAVNRLTRKGVRIGADQCLGVYDALRGITVNAAYAYHEEDRKGTLEAGKLADLVILDRNPLKVEKMELKDIVVVETIKEGEVLYRADGALGE